MFCYDPDNSVNLTGSRTVPSKQTTTNANNVPYAVGALVGEMEGSFVGANFSFFKHAINTDLR